MRINGVIGRIHAQIDGVKYEPGPIKASEADKITGWTGYSLREWEGNVVSTDPLALRALIALDRFRKGEHVKISDVDIEDIDSCDADLKDEHGRVLSLKQDPDGKPLIVGGNPVLLFDGEEDPAPLGGSPTG